MDIETIRWILGGLLGLLVLVIGYFAKRNSEAIDKTRDDLAAHKTDVAEKYARRDEMVALGRKIEENTKITNDGFTLVNKNIADLAVSSGKIEATVATIVKSGDVK